MDDQNYYLPEQQQFYDKDLITLLCEKCFSDDRFFIGIKEKQNGVDFHIVRKCSRCGHEMVLKE